MGVPHQVALESQALDPDLEAASRSLEAPSVAARAASPQVFTSLFHYYSHKYTSKQTLQAAQAPAAGLSTHN